VESGVSSEPLISVLIPVFNGEKYLLQSLQSIQSQTYQHLEILVVNDGSVDRSAPIIDQFLKSDRRVRAIHKSRSGLTDSLNVGLAAARGDYIARLDCDDWADVSRLELQVARVKQDPSLVLVGSDFSTFNEESGETRDFRLPQGHKALLSRLSRLGGFFPHSAALFHLKTARELGGYDSEALYNEDWDLWLKLSEHGRITSVSRKLVTIREHQNQTTKLAKPILPISEAFISTVLHHLRVRNAPTTTQISLNRKLIRQYALERPEFQEFQELVRSQIVFQSVRFAPQSTITKIRQLLYMKGILKTLLRLWFYKTRGTDAPHRVAIALSTRDFD
jgi:glycosyltransferase involved in cell wall biosynthesis